MSGRDVTVPEHLREAYEVTSSGAAQILPADGLAERLVAADREGRPLRVKLGIDPSGTDLTLGHAVVLRKLRQFQDFGHTAVLVVGALFLPYVAVIFANGGREPTPSAHFDDREGPEQKRVSGQRPEIRS